jgi:NAD(P)-dependent dehydrogenase (short-subunit alcohol dehydrogenase family)
MTNATTQDDSLAGKVAVITGSARGIGLAIATKYAALGAKVVISDLDADNSAAAAGQLPGATSFACDVRSEDSVSALIDHALNLHGQVDIVVANAGIATVAPVTEMPLEQWRNLMSINLDGAFLTVKHGARAMLSTGTKGSIITIGSITATAGTPLLAHYSASKAAVVNLTKSAAIELRPQGIRVNSILPGFAETVLVTGNRQQFVEMMSVDFDEIMTMRQGGYLDIDNLAQVAAFLAGDRSAFCTGGEYVVDGGMTASLM